MTAKSSVDGVGLVLRNREVGGSSKEAIYRRLQLPEAFVNKLHIEDVLRGHLGCVNRLAWNAEGTMMASGSDDRQILLWNYPRAQQLPIRVETLHQANIFGVAFLPETNNMKIVSGAMDHSVQLHRLDHEPLKSREGETQASRLRSQHRYHFDDGPPMKVRTIDAHTTIYNCHHGRVKSVEVEPGNPHMFWSASEDGTVRQLDTRSPHQGGHMSPNVLLAIRQKTRNLELFAAKLNKARPEQIAVACNDQFVRIYDRRMLSPGTPSDFATGRNVAHPMLKLAPPQMCLRNPRRNTLLNMTFVAFSSRGDKVLANYHSDHCYSFDITASADSAVQAVYPSAAPAESCSRPSQPFLSRIGPINILQTDASCSTSWKASELPAKAQAAKNAGNRSFFDTDDTSAIYHYTEAIHIAPSCALLYYCRAAAYLKRGWIADSWAALQDSETAIHLDPSLIKAHCRRILALTALGQLQAARAAAAAFAIQFPASVDDIERVRHAIVAEETQRKSVLEQAVAARAERRERRRATQRQDEGMQHNNSPTAREDGAEASDPTYDGASSGSEESGLELESREGWLREEDSLPSSSADLGMSSSKPLLFGDARIPGAPHRTMQRFMGHSNVHTDIKEATFIGGNDEMVAACSDDGHVFIYNAETGSPVQALKADEDVVNCVQPHPFQPVLATSGIESSVRLWSPGEGVEKARAKSYLLSLISYNQERMKSQTNLFSTVTPRVMAALSQNSELLHMLMAMHRDRSAANDTEADPAAPPPQHEVSCRVT